MVSGENEKNIISDEILTFFKKFANNMNFEAQLFTASYVSYIL